MRKRLRNYFGIMFGSVITAVSLNVFLIPNKVAAGGVSGMATVLHYLLGWPVGLTMLALNIPLFLISVKVLGARFGLNTLVGAVVLSLAVDLTASLAPVLTHDLLLNSLYGGVAVGVGMGIVFKSEGTTAGTDLAAAILNRLLGISVGQALLAVDFFVITSAGIAFKNVELSLYALIALFISTQIIDVVQAGPSSGKAFFIVTATPEILAEHIIKKMARGVTFFHGKGGYSKQFRDVLLCVVSASEVTRLKELVSYLDPQAFVIVADVHEVLGEGFSEMKAQHK